MKKSRSQIIKEFLAKKAADTAKDKTLDLEGAENKNETKSTDNLKKAFFKAIATKDVQMLRNMQADIEKEYKALGDGQNVTDNADGGYLVPVELNKQIIEKLTYLSPIRGIATVINIGAKTKFNVADGLPTAYWVGEGEKITRSKATFGQKEITLNKIAGLGGFSYESLTDTSSIPNLQDYVTRVFAEALAIKENDAFVNGDGDDKPYGFRSGDITPTTKTAPALNYKSILKAKFALGKAYRDLATFMAGSTIMQSIVGLEDGNKRPLFIPAITETNGDRLLGRPIVEVTEIPDDELWFAYMNNYIIGQSGALRVDFGTTGDDFETDKISMRIINRVGGRPIMSTGFAKLKLTGTSS